VTSGDPSAKPVNWSWSARRDSVLLVISSSPDNASPTNAAMIAIDATSASAQAASVRHGRRLLHTANRSVITADPGDHRSASHG
jgi:hypothetical protein